MRREAAVGKLRPHPGNPAAGGPIFARCDLPALGERQITTDCDVRRRWRHLHRRDHRRLYRAQPVRRLYEKTGLVTAPVIKDHVAAVSCGIVWARRCWTRIDEDSTAETDANFVLTGAGGLVEPRHGGRCAV
jgi:ribonuclease PH